MECDRAYGFAVQVHGRELLQGNFELSHSSEGDTSKASAVGVAIVARPYEATPESTVELQPLITPKAVLAYEGRVDNRQEIAFALGKPELAEAPDGTVLLAAYEAWGADLSAKVIGEFAFIVFDRADREVVAGQDSLGVRRVYYRADGRVTWIASDLRLLFEHFPDARPQVDAEAMPEYFTGDFEPWSGRTIWRGLRELRRGGVLIERAGAIAERTVWHPDPQLRLRLRGVREVDEAFRTVFFQGITAALRSSRPILCDLSGGFDSSTVCLAASRLVGGSLVAWAYNNRRSSDGEFREVVLQQCGMERHVIEMKDHLPFRTIDDREIPTVGLVQTGGVAKVVRELALARGIRTRLTGYGGDALFHKGSPPHYLGDLLRACRLADLARDFGAYVRGGRYNIWQLLRLSTMGSVDRRAGAPRVPLPSWLTERFRRVMGQAERDYARRERLFPSTARELLYRSTLMLIRPHGAILPDERLPLVYRPLVELILGLDWEHMVSPDQDRLLMRRGLRDILPETLLRGGERGGGHGSPMIEGLRANWSAVAHLVSGERLAELGVVEPKLFRQTIQALRGGNAGRDLTHQVTTTAIYLEVWLSLKALQRGCRIPSPTLDAATTTPFRTPPTQDRPRNIGPAFRFAR